MAQSRKTQVICIGLSKELRLIVRSRSYRVQIMGQTKKDVMRFHRRWSQYNTIMWHDVQIIPRTQRREDIPFEVTTAYAAFRRREQELQGWFSGKTTEDRIRTIINRVVGSGLYKGSQVWTVIRSGIDQEFRHDKDNRRLSSQDRIGWELFQNYMTVRALKENPYLWSKNGSTGIYDEVIHEFKSSTGKTRNASQHTSWERYASPQSFGLRKKHHADASLRRTAFQER